MSAETIVGYCRACGKALPESDVHKAQGAMYCKEHVPMEGAPSSPYNPPPYSGPHPDISPGLAFGLGFIPGVGAIYNGQYAKGLVHVAVIGVLISILNSDIPEHLEPMVALMLVAFWAYMPFEAYHTARNRQLGHPVDELSSLVPMRGSQFPAAPVILIALGTVLLLDNLGIFELRRTLRFWPVLLIGAGLYMLYNRFFRSKGPRP
jgi:cell wall-active antibiotic response 4TMS protein YvqF